MRGQHDQDGVAVVAARLRRVRPRLMAAMALGPVLGIVATVVFGVWPGALAVPVAILAACVGYVVARRFRPRGWPRAAALFGVAAGVYAGLTVPGFGWAVAPVAAAALGALGYAVADDARAKVLRPYLPELADSPLEVSWPARGARGLELLVGADRITLVGSRGRLRTVRPAFGLAGVGAVEQVMVARRATLHVPGVGELNVTVTPGPAVRISVPHGEWILPTDQGRDIARLVARRKALASPGAP